MPSQGHFRDQLRADDRDVFQASPDELPATDINSL